MGIINSLKNLGRKAAAIFKGEQSIPVTNPTLPVPHDVPDTVMDRPRFFPRSTTASRRRERALSMRYRHVSQPITDDMRLAVALKRPDLVAKLLRQAVGITYHVGINAVKRSIGRSTMSRREIRAARTMFIRELREAGIK